MTHYDLGYVKRLIDQGVARGRVLELGAGWGGATCRKLFAELGSRYVGTDLHAGEGVDTVADFENGEGVGQVGEPSSFDTVLVLNVLEHTFQPLQVLDNAIRLLVPGGVLVVIAPVVWPIHNYPRDYGRLLPDWYRQYAATRGMVLDEKWFEYVGIGPVSAYRAGDLDSLPPCSARNHFYRLYSRVIHRCFNTFGRGVSHPTHVCIGAVIRKHSVS